jgi:exodeoxyribonuclease V alpha subunit
MTELAGQEAVTIHRLLETGYAPDSMDLVFRRDANNPLKCDAMIVDECSMIDITLMRALLAALPPDCRLILVGDADQLPPVGPGNVFLDILRSHAVPVIRLTEIFRQTAESRIIRYAHQINAGEHPNLSENKGDFFFLRRMNQDAARELIVQLCAERLPKNMGIPATEIQVLTPMRRGAAGVVSLNEALQKALNPPAPDKPEKHYGERVFRVGDRVMQIRNNYDIIWMTADDATSGAGVYNGDIGYILAVDQAGERLIVDYDGHLASYGFDMLSELEHAWAMTVHKSQGSEYRAVILCTVGAPPQLQYRSLLYTAVTRARELLIAVGDETAVRHMIDNHKQARRYSGLRARLAGENG